jgi:Cof subfamily protein (haloacid dehalogenase superfamily)/HAD superfamily hydrolase (TIGR01509 family)
MTIKLLIADVDGTLLTKSKVLTPRTAQAVDRLRAAGVRFTITSGRPPRGMASIVGPLKITAPVAAFNGAVYVMPDLTTVISQRTLRPSAARQAVDHLLGAGLDVWVYRGADWFVRDPNAYRVERESHNVGFQPNVTQDLYGLLDEAVKIVGVSQDHALVARCEGQLGALLGADAAAARSQPYYLDVTHPEANKGMVVREAARFLRIGVEEVATIGDMPNDVPMLAIAGRGIAMGNASAEVQRAARHVTSSNEEEGFARAVDELILGAPPYARTPLGLPPRARACLFGLDGVLTELARAKAHAWKQLFDPYLRERAQTSRQPYVPFDLVHDYSRYLDGRPGIDGMRAFLDSRGVELPEPTLRALAHRESDILVETLRRDRAEAYEGSLHYLRSARDAGLRTAVVTSHRHCQEALEAAGMTDLFDARIDGVVAAAEHLASKPAPDGFLAAARALGVSPDEAVVFEDQGAGVEAGRAGHFAFVIGVDRGGRAQELRKHGADLVVPDLGALLEPDVSQPYPAARAEASAAAPS